MAFTFLFGLFGCKESTDPSTWSSEKIDKWFEKGEWKGGWQINPDASINRKALAVSYFKYKDRWDKAFAFLKDNDLTQMELKRFDIDGDIVFAPVSEYMTKTEEAALYEAHRRYLDIQYVVSGKELIGIAPLSQTKDILEPYDDTRDIMFMTVNGGKNLEANPGKFFIFFPDDVHRPGLRDGDSTLVRKVVVKIRLD